MNALVTASSEDTRWVESTMSRLHTSSKIETIESGSVSVLEKADWGDFSELVLRNCLRHAGQDKRDQVKGQLDFVPVASACTDRTYHLCLDYSYGGAQYMSCFKFASKRTSNGKIIFVYAMFGKKWKERHDYALNREFWENRETQKKLYHFLEAGAAGSLAAMLEGGDGEAALQDALGQ